MIIAVIEKIFLIYKIMLIVRIFGSWVPEIQGQRWMQFIAFYTDPYMNLFRRIIPPLGMIDISPILAFIALGFIEQGIFFLLYKMIA